MLFRAISGRSVLRQDFGRVYETLLGQLASDRKLFLPFFLCSKVICQRLRKTALCLNTTIRNILS